MDAGNLDQRIILRRKTETQNTYGTLVPTTNDYAQVWAKVKSMSGGEGDRGQQVEARRMYMVTIRNRRDVLEKDFVVWGGKELNVRRIDDEGERPLYIELMCEYGAP